MSTPEIDIERFAEAGPSGTVVDVRERHEYATGHVGGAVLIPMGQLAAWMQELDRTRTVYLICATGTAPLAVTDELREAGFDAWSVSGGTAAWARSGRPVEGGLR